MTKPSDDPKPPMLFSVRDTPRFPRAVWDRFRARVTARGENWIDVLRRLVEHYADEPDKERPPS